MLMITEAKKADCFVCKRTGCVNQMFGDFVKMTLTQVIDCNSSRVDSFGKKRDTSRVFTLSFLNVTPVESPRIVARVETSH